MPERLEIKLGTKYGKLTLIDEVYPFCPRKFLCRCDCGKEKVILLTSVKTGKTVSCGCHHKSIVTSHGMTKTRIHSIWRDMKYRCDNPNNSNYIRYGAKGIKVCKRWYKFENFYKDMGATYKDKLTIDRIDGTKDYKPSNCRWATMSEQIRNRSISIYHKGEIMWDANKRLGGGISLIGARLALGWSKEKAFSTPARKRLPNKKLTIFNIKK